MTRIPRPFRQAERYVPDPWWVDVLLDLRDLAALVVIVAVAALAAWFLMALWLAGGR